ncbi:MAG: Piriform spidroin [Parcubacteria group bacterium GW2011_GWA1_54_9]|nr:MAG: Piriform spidroin [Parcubacteria group bacterium GW2011_GWA1_54_9]
MERMDTNTATPDLNPNDGLPKKYIRTLAGDMKIVEQGGTPDLAPLTPRAIPAPAPVPKPVPTPVPALELVPAPPQAPLPPEVSRVGEKSSPIETYASDFSDRVKKTGAVTATILAAEQDSAPRPLRTEDIPSSSKKNLFYSIAGTMLVVIGAGAAYFSYTHFAAPPLPAVIESVPIPIFVDEREQISGSGAVLLQAIEQSVSRPLAPRTVRLLYTASSSTSDSIFSSLPLSAPDILRRNVNAVGSMAGVASAGGGSASGGNAQSPFFILSVTTYRDTFAGMLSWERMMPRDLEPLFPSYPAAVPQTVGTTTVSTGSTTLTTSSSPQAAATSTPPAPVSTPVFRDEVVVNHDVRIYRDAAGKSVVIYGYWNPTTLVIARDPGTFAEILSRLATSPTQQ